MHLGKFNALDIAVFIETARSGKLAAAATSLKVDHTTAFRRLKGLENRLGYSLFDRTERNYVLTLEGHRLFELAEAIESDIYAFEREAFATDISKTGVIRVTTPDSLGINFLPQLLGRFHATHPSIQVEISVRNQFLNLSKREADIAIRPATKLEGDMVARNAATMGFALYATRQYLDCNGEPENAADLAKHTICGFDEALSGIGAQDWLRSHLKKTTPAYRFDNTTALLGAVRTGFCIGVCPCFMGDSHNDLRRLSNFEVDRSTIIWIATHPEIRHAARVRAFMDFAYEEIRCHRSLFSGELNPE